MAFGEAPVLPWREDDERLPLPLRTPDFLTVLEPSSSALVEFLSHATL